MKMNPLNLIIRFILEMTALVIMGIWGWKLTDEWYQVIIAVGIPLLAAIAWGTFNVLGDPSRSGEAPIIVTGFLRLTIELGIFMCAAWMLYDIGQPKFSTIFVLTVILHYIASYKRIIWLFSH